MGAAAAALLCGAAAYLALVLRANYTRHRWYLVPLAALPALAFATCYVLAVVWS